VAISSPAGQVASAQGLLGATGLAAAGLTGLIAGAVYEHVGRLAVCGGTAAVMVLLVGTAIRVGTNRDAANSPTAFLAGG
jgi:hypothetical protein